MNKVVVTGMGMITALGKDVNTTWENMLEGKSGVRTIQSFDPSELDTQFAAEVSDDFEEKADEIIPKRQRRKMTRATRMLMVAADEAVEDSGINFEELEDKTRSAVILGVVTAGNNEFERSKSSANFIVKTMANAPSAWLSIKYGIEGPAFSVATACASSAYAIDIANKMIRAGVIDVAIVGGMDSHIEPDYIKGFNQILAMSARNDSPETASRPFSKTRDGFVMGEGSGVLILESEAHAKARNAKIYAEMIGSAVTSEAEDITSPITDGSGMAKTMLRAIQDANIDCNEVDYINAHGTSTYLNDKCETLAVKQIFGDHSTDIPVTSSKSMIGHTIAAAGAIEGIVCVKTICEGVITPTINYEEADEELDLDYVPNTARRQDVNVALTNSFGFGGHNATLVFKKYEN